MIRASRLVAKGEDPFGLGRWSYVTLRGKNTTKVTIVTAYNATTSAGDCTYYHQQLRVLSRLHREQGIASPPNPRHQFILDLQSWLQHLSQEGHQFILAMDANDVFDPDQVVPSHPLVYTRDKLTVNSSHDGKIATLVATCHLCLPLARQHPTRPFPASHIMGRNQIDYILVSETLLPAVQRSGVLSHHSLIRGDHRPYYLDFDAALLFSDPAYRIEPATFRKLRLQDPRNVTTYRSRLHELLATRNVVPRLDKLQQHIEQGTWTYQCQEEYERLDRTITESMLTAEQALSKRITTTYQWSPQLKQAVQCLRYWSIRLRAIRNQPISSIQLNHYQIEGAIPPEQAAFTAEKDITQAQHEAYTHLKKLQEQHEELRESYLEGLAEAIILNRIPKLNDEGLESIKREKVAKQLSQLLSREKVRKMFRKIGRTLNKTPGKGLSRIDVPDPAAVNETSGDPANPKTWRGPWKTVTNPQEIAKVICQVNTEQYHQAHVTPFGSGPLADILGRRGDTPSSVDLLRGTIPDLPPLLMPETLRILQTMAREAPAATGSSIITAEEFVSTYAAAGEHTSSSPSGRHIGHYKATLEDPLLVRLHSSMMSIPFQMGFAPERWTKVTDIMLEKDQDNPRCHRLRILALFESDLNHAKRIIIGRKLLHHMNDNTMIPEMQYGSVPGKHCLSAVLKKVLCHDHLRLTKQNGAFLENDAVGCYDRLVNNLVLMLMVKLGIPKTVAACIGDLWDNVVHLIKTVYGISSVTYTSSSKKPLYGPGQGSTCGPIFWLLCYWVIVSSLDPSITAAKFISVCKDIIVEITGVSFVDDSSLAVTTDYQYDPTLTDAVNKWKEVEHLANRLAALGQHWERLLFSTGGAINFQKSHWYLIQWLWKQGIPQMATSKQAPATIALTSGYNTIPDIVP